MIRLLIILICSAAFFCDTIAQTAESFSDVITVDIREPNYPLKVELIKPEALNQTSKSRGFKRIVGSNVRFEGYASDRNGIKTISINGGPVVLDSNDFFSLELTLEGGVNELLIEVTDEKGNFESKSYVFTVESDDSEPVVIGNYYALIIGINEYEDENIIDLDKPIEDAHLLSNVLTDRYLFYQENIKLLENPSREVIIDALDEFSRTITEKDNLLIFYAGHGYWDDENEVGYWIPTDGREESTAEWFRNSTLTNQIRSIKSKHTLLIADACFSGTIFKARSAFLDADKAINLKYSLPSRKAMTSGAMTQVPDRSAFLKYLVKRLKENDDKYLASSTLFHRLETAVINNSDENITPQYGTIQKVGDEGGDFIFIRRDSHEVDE